MSFASHPSCFHSPTAFGIGNVIVLLRLVWWPLFASVSWGVHVADHSFRAKHSAADSNCYRVLALSPPAPPPQLLFLNSGPPVPIHAVVRANQIAICVAYPTENWLKDYPHHQHFRWFDNIKSVAFHRLLPEQQTHHAHNIDRGHVLKVNWIQLDCSCALGISNFVRMNCKYEYFGRENIKTKFAKYFSAGW